MKKLEGNAQKVLKKVAQVMDPELYVSIVELGLVYDVKVVQDTAKITMTLTSLGCPLFPMIQSQVEAKVKEVKEIKNVEINLTFDPPWSMDMMSESARANLGM